MRVIKLKDIPNIQLYYKNTSGDVSMQPHIIMTDVSDNYLSYGAQLVVDMIKRKITYDKYDDHRIIFSADGFIYNCAVLEFNNAFTDEQYKVIEFLIFLVYKSLFVNVYKKKKNTELLMKEMDRDYYERNIDLMSNIIM